MRKHLSLFLMFLGFVFFVSCSSGSKSHNDTDMIPDDDSDDIETVDDDFDSQDPEIVDDSDETFDADADSDTSEKVECLDLRYNENTIKTPFPFKDANGKPTFCRPGCDTPTENDPQCVRNILEWDNWENYQIYLKAQEKDPNQQEERECYPWPCKLPGMQADSSSEILKSSCDRLLTVNGFSTGILNGRGLYANNHGMSDGVAGMGFIGEYLSRVIEYDPEKDEYSALSHSYYAGFNENRYVVQIYDRNPNLYKDAKLFVVSILRKDGGYFYEFIYDLSENGEKFSDSPFAGQNWVMLRLNNLKTLYASTKDWEWHELDGVRNYVGDGNIVGDHAVFVANDYEIYYCNLKRLPKHLDNCSKLNRKDESDNTEYGISPKIDADNERRVVYNIYRTPVFVEVDFSVPNRKYTEYRVNSDYYAVDWEISMLKGKTVSYTETLLISNGLSRYHGCFYRFDKQETYNLSETFFASDLYDNMYFNVFWGKWHLWKMIAGPEAVIRDMDCYCKEENICPFEE